MVQVFNYSPTGRGNSKLEFEVKQLQELLDGTDTLITPAWYDTQLGGNALYSTYTSLSYGKQHHWRVRFKYSPVTNPFNPPYSRWYHMPWNGWNEADLRAPTSSLYLYLPFVIR